jgi:hypothetical protein
MEELKRKWFAVYKAAQNLVEIEMFPDVDKAAMWILNELDRFESLRREKTSEDKEQKKC